MINIRILLTKSGTYLTISKLLIVTCIIITLLPEQVNAHKGPIDQIDDCRIRVSYEWIHFTAYTPSLTGTRAYCKNIPELAPTNLVFDYEGKKLRQFTIEFEVTKEPEGTRVFYQEPKLAKSGTVNGQVDLRKFGAGDYLAHITIVHNNKALDTHLDFTAGISERSYSGLIKILLTVIGITGALYFLIRKAQKMDAKSTQ